MMTLNCYDKMVLSVQGNATLCDVSFMSKTKPPSKDLDSDTVQSGAGSRPIRSIVDIWLTRKVKLLAKFFPVPSRIESGFVCDRNLILRTKKSRCHTQTFQFFHSCLHSNSIPQSVSGGESEAWAVWSSFPRG
jgi:hypothetical protein